MHLACAACLAACGDSTETSAEAPCPPRTSSSPRRDEEVWAQLPPDRSAIPVLLYHGIGPESDFSDDRDASYGVDTEDFAKQMTLIEARRLRDDRPARRSSTSCRAKPVDLPPRPVLLTFDDARADSWTGADGILDELGFNAVMFVDVGPRRRRRSRIPHLGRSSRRCRTAAAGSCSSTPARATSGSDTAPDADDYGPFYAYEKHGEDFDDWRERVRSDIDWGQGDARRPHPGLPSRSPSLRRTATTARTAPTTRGSPTTCSAG